MSTHFWEFLPNTIPTEDEWRQALREVQSHEFDFKLNVVSGFQAFFNAAGREPSVRVLYEAMVVSGEVREVVLGRLHDLSLLEVDRRYENPNDTALAVLLWLTFFAAQEHQQNAADLVDRAQQGWYAKKLARWILTPRPIDSGNQINEKFPSKGVNTGSLPGALSLMWAIGAESVTHLHLREPHADSSGGPNDQVVSLG